MNDRRVVEFQGPHPGDVIPNRFNEATAIHPIWEGLVIQYGVFDATGFSRYTRASTLFTRRRSLATDRLQLP